jgi:hypothetical protein
MRKIVLTYGLIAGAILSAMMLVSVPFHDELGLDKAAVVGYTTMVLAFLLIYFGVRTYRDEIAGGQVSFWQACKVGLLIMVVASACYVATWEVVYFKLAPDYIERYTTLALEEARQDGATEAALAAKAKELGEFAEMYRNPLVNVAMTFLEPLPVGLLFTLVSAGLLSRKRREDGVAIPSEAEG